MFQDVQVVYGRCELYKVVYGRLYMDAVNMDAAKGIIIPFWIHKKAVYLFIYFITINYFDNINSIQMLDLVIVLVVHRTVG